MKKLAIVFGLTAVIAGLGWLKKFLYDEFIGYPSNPLPPVQRDGADLQGKFKGRGRE